MIAKLVDEGVVEEIATPPAEAVDDARRRYYGVTDLDRRAVAAEAARLRRLLDNADRARLMVEG